MSLLYANDLRVLENEVYINTAIQVQNVLLYLIRMGAGPVLPCMSGPGYRNGLRKHLIKARGYLVTVEGFHLTSDERATQMTGGDSENMTILLNKFNQLVVRTNSAILYFKEAIHEHGGETMEVE